MARPPQETQRRKTLGVKDNKELRCTGEKNGKRCRQIVAPGGAIQVIVKGKHERFCPACFAEYNKKREAEDE